MATATMLETGTDSSSDDVEKHFHCQPCEGEGSRHIAVGYCVNCHEYLCQRCYDGHLIPSICKKHVLLDKEHMAEIKCHHLCEQHSNREIEYHCATHSLFGCHICFFQHQKSCKNTVFIPEVCMSTATTEEMHLLNEKLDCVKNKCTEFILDINSKLHTVETYYGTAISDIQDFKQEILNKIEKHVQELVDKADMVRKSETSRYEAMTLKLKNTILETEKTISSFKMFENLENTSDIYINLVKTKQKVHALEDNLLQITRNTTSKQFRFHANNDLSRIFMSKFGLGSLQQNTCIDKVEHVRDINCRSVNDTSTCCITGITYLPDHSILVADWGGENKALKVFDIDQYKLQTEIKLSASPYDVCRITDCLVAVTLTNVKKIAFVKTQPNLQVERELGVNGEPCGIGFLNGKLVVSYKSPFKVEVMDMQTAYTVIATFDSDRNGKTLLNCPYRLGINPVNELIYISNMASNNLVCMSLDGTVVTAYKDDDELIRPRQISFDSNGMVYVCCDGSNNVLQLTEDCKKIKVILNQENGMDKPCSIFIQENERRLIICQRNSDTMKVYQMTYSDL